VLKPGAFGTIVIVNSLPPATRFTSKSDTAAGAGPGVGPVVRKTNGIGLIPTGTLNAGATVVRYQPRGALASRSSPGSWDVTS
jgi:hypothetical protein